MRFRMKVHWPWLALGGFIVMAVWTVTLFQVGFYQAKADWYRSQAKDSENKAWAKRIENKWEHLMALEHEYQDVASNRKEDIYVYRLMDEQGERLAKNEEDLNRLDERLNVISEVLTKWRLANPAGL